MIEPDFNTWRPDPKPEPKEKKAYKGLRNKPRESTGELELFRKIYEKRGRKCGITKQPLVFHVECFMHVLSKGSHPSFRLE